MARWKSVLAILMILTILLTPMKAFAESSERKNITVSEISVSNSNYFGNFTIAKEKTKKISINVSPKNATKKDLLWKTSDTTVVSVSDQGVITGLKNGKADIIVSTMDGSKLELCIPVIVGIPVKSITGDVKNLTLTEGNYYETKVTVLPKNATGKQVEFRSSNQKVATVSDTGVIEAISPGKATVTMTAKDGSGKRGTVFVAVNAISDNRTLTDHDVMDGRINLSDTYFNNLTIDSSVGSAAITLDNITVRGNLVMANNAGYTLYAKNSKINHVEVDATDTEFGVAKKSPTFETSDGTNVTTMNTMGNMSVKQKKDTQIGSINIGSGNKESLKLKLEGFCGNLLVNTSPDADIEILTTGCKIQNATYSGSSSAKMLTLMDVSTGDQQSSIDKMNVETCAKLDLDIRSKELNISARVVSALITVRKSVDKITNGGILTDISIFGKVQNIISTGEKSFIKMEMGSECTALDTSGDKSTIYLASSSFVDSVTTKGKGTLLTGIGVINNVKVEGNDTVIEDLGATVTVGKKVTGTIFLGIPIGDGVRVKSDHNGGLIPIYIYIE